MSMDETRLFSAVSDFRRARNQAVLEEIIARFTGDTVELLSYEEVRQQLKAQESASSGLEDIPLDSIVGSVGRYNDFTRDFLPRTDADQERWARVKIAVTGMAGLDPIEVYQLGETYFVKDGNHRVSVARQLGATHIQAYITRVKVRVPLKPGVKPDDIIIMAEYVEFLEHTKLDESRPEANLTVTAPGQYPILEEHIAVHRYYMGLEQEREIPIEEASVHWYDQVYLPVVEIIRERGALHNFSERTETDLYLWIAQHQAAIEANLGWHVQTEKALSDLLTRHTPPPSNIFALIGSKLLDAVTVTKLESGPPVGQWRQESVAVRRDDRLFVDILVPINGLDEGWNALDLSSRIAHQEGANIHGLFVINGEQAAIVSERVNTEFHQRLEQQGLQGDLSIVSGEIADQICKKAIWTDLIVTNLAHPPGDHPIERLESGFRELIQRCPRPIMIAPNTTSELNHALLAYDGSPKADEALFVATYLSGRWHIPLTVVTVFESDHIPPETLMRARVYLEEHEIQANYVAKEGPVTEIILAVAAENQVDFIVMGGYGINPVLGVVLGSDVDQLLRETQLPILVCR